MGCSATQNDRLKKADHPTCTIQSFTTRKRRRSRWGYHGISSELFVAVLLCLQFAHPSFAEAAGGRSSGMSDSWFNVKGLLSFVRRNRRDKQPGGIQYDGASTQGEGTSRVFPVYEETASTSLSKEKEDENKPFENLLDPIAKREASCSPSSSSTPTSFVVQAIIGIFQKWGKHFASGAQIAIIAYLVHAFWSAAVSYIHTKNTTVNCQILLLLIMSSSFLVRR